MSLTVLVDCDGGNLHSAQKAFERMAPAGMTILVSDRPEDIARADCIVLPGDGAFAACRSALDARDGLVDALEEAVLTRARPFLGICIGMQMLATWGREHGDTPGLDWIGGDVVRIVPAVAALKVPHMGWNDLVIDEGGAPHPVLAGIASGDHAYFVHSYQFVAENPAHRLAHVDHSAEISAIVARDTIVGVQFHPEKSQAAGLRLIANFLDWRP